MPLNVNSFGDGLVINGAADTRKVGELLQADSVDIGVRGALIAASDLTAYVTLEDGGNNALPWSRLHALLPCMPGSQEPQVVAVGEGRTASPGTYYLTQAFNREGVASPVNSPSPMGANNAATEGCVVTGYSWPGAWTLPAGNNNTEQVNVAFCNLGAREGFTPKSNNNFGLYVLVQIVGDPGFVAFPIKQFNALGTGADGDGTQYAGNNNNTYLDTGSAAQQLYFRGIIAFNDFLFGWGFDSSDATNGDGPARVMFCNLGLPLKWGNDNVATQPGNRMFSDSDAITLGDAGELIRGAIVWAGKVWFGTNQQLHYIGGYGRDSFLTDGATPVQKAFNVVGPHALIEGPDRKMYGVCDQGLWRSSMDAGSYWAYASSFEPIFRKLQDFTGQSNGLWDCIWTDITRDPTTYPGTTNQDLVWLVNDWIRRQVVVGIPFCSMANGYGYGLDTLLVKYNVDTDGFTRQWFPGVQLTAAAYLRREGQQRDVRMIGQATPGQATVSYYGFQANASVQAVMPTILPAVEFGPFAPFGSDGRGTLRRLYLTLSWITAASLPLVFQVVTTWDEATEDSFLLTIALVNPLSAVVGDLWLDTSGTDGNIGNATAGSITPAFPSALLKQWNGTAWIVLPRQGSNGTRATIRLPLMPRNGTRITVQVQTLTAAGRFQFEALGEKPGAGEAAA